MLSTGIVETYLVTSCPFDVQLSTEYFKQMATDCICRKQSPSHILSPSSALSESTAWALLRLCRRSVSGRLRPLARYMASPLCAEKAALSSRDFIDLRGCVVRSAGPAIPHWRYVFCPRSSSPHKLSLSSALLTHLPSNLSPKPPLEYPL